MKTVLTSVTTKSGRSGSDANRVTLMRMCGAKNKPASPDELKELLIGCNYSDGTRIVDWYYSFGQLAMLFGTRGEWALGMKLTHRLRHRLFESVAKELHLLLEGNPDCRARVFKWVRFGGGIELEEIPVAELRIAGKYLTVLIPLDLLSNQTGSDVWLRLDIRCSPSGRAIYEAVAVLLSDEDGNSIVGFGDITDYVVHLDGFPKALEEVLGHGYDVFAVNASIYRAWWENHHAETSAKVVEVDIAEVDCSGRPVSIVLVAVPGVNAWTLHFKIGPEMVPVEDYVPELGLAVDPTEAFAEWQQLVKMFRAPFMVSASMRIGHVFEDHLERYAGDYLEQLPELDPQAVADGFFAEVEQAIERLRKDENAWIPAVYNAGQEADLEFAGEEIDSSVYLLAPLYLTRYAKETEIPTVYLVAVLRRNENGEDECYFPSVLDTKNALNNMRNLQRAIGNAVCVPEYAIAG